MPARWLEALGALCRGMVPANELARKHPFVLNCKLEPLRWAKLAVRGRLPLYTWTDVLRDLKRNTGKTPFPLMITFRRPLSPPLPASSLACYRSGVQHHDGMLITVRMLRAASVTLGCSLTSKV